MSLIKALNKKETTFASPPSYIQLTIKVENVSAIKELEDYFKKAVACLHLRFKDQNHLEYRDEIQKFHIPSSLTKLQDIGRFVGMNFTPPCDIAFGSIATNEENKIIVLNASHRFCDGGFFKFILKNYFFNIFPKETPHFPRFTSVQFAEQIKNSPDIKSYLNDSTLSRIQNLKLNPDIKLTPKNILAKEFKYVYHPNGNYNFSGNVIGDKSNNQKLYIEEEEIYVPAKEYATYNPKTNAPGHLTEYLWLSQYFAGSAYKLS